MSALLDTAKQAVALALKKGAKEAAASAYKSRDVSIGWRDGKVEKVSEATTRGVSLQLYVDGRYTAVSTSDLRPDALESFLGDAIAMARTLAKDANRSLPDPKLYEGRSRDDLQLLDSAYADYTPEARRKQAKELEEAARAAKGAEAILSVTTSVSDSSTQSAKATSNGFEGEVESTDFWLSADVSCKDADGRRPEAGDYAGTRTWKSLPSAAEVGAKASARALETLGAKKVESAVLPIVVENRAAGRLLRALLGALTGRALQQKQSFLEGEAGKTIGSKLLTLTDDPLVVRGFGSRLYDGDGIAAKKLPIFEAGVLKNYYIDVYYGRKLGVAPTTGSSSNLVLPPGKKGLADLLKDVKEGVLITGFLGGNSNSTTGDYSLGIQGFRVRKGQKAEPISEMNISGNQKDLWKKLSAVGNDPWLYSSTRTPTLVFDGVQIAGL
jgi:PmbA protein